MGILDNPNTVALLHCIGANGSTTFTDESGKTWTANGTAQISTAQAKFGTSSGLLDGDSDWIDTPSHADFEFGNGDVTIDWQEYRTSTAGGCAIISRDATSTFSPFLLGYSNAAGGLIVYMSSDGANWDIASGKSLGSLSVNTWSHRMYVRSGNNHYLFKDGTTTDTWLSSASFLANSNRFSVGKSQNGAYFPGYFQEVHIMKGVALHTANFTAPTAPYGSSFVPRIMML